jgi:putative addiction module component (TIGR02574 family)
MNEELRNQINKLSVSEKILLVEEIWDSIANEEQSFDLTDAQRKTILKRSNELNENPAIGRRWEEIRDEFLGKYK